MAGIGMMSRKDYDAITSTWFPYDHISSDNFYFSENYITDETSSLT